MDLDVSNRPWIGYGCLLFVWAVSIVIVHPAGNFPLNDDWAYGRAVQSMVHDGRLVFSGWTSMPLITQLLWGYLFSLPFGFSFEALRASTLAMSLIGTWATLALLRECGIEDRLAFLGGLLIALNPLYMELSFTFMTDVPFYALSVLAFYCLVRGVKRSSPSAVFLGFAFAVAATLLRQLGAVLAPAFAIAYIQKSGFTRRAISTAVIGVAVVGGVLITYEMMIAASIGLPKLYHARDAAIVKTFHDGPVIFAKRLAAWGYVAFLYLGLFLLPVLVTRIPDLSLRRTSRIFYLGLLLVAVALLGVSVSRDRLLPLGGNIISEFGLGPMTLRDVFILKVTHLREMSQGTRVALTALGLVGGMLFLAQGFGLISAGMGKPRVQRPGSSEPGIWVNVFLISAGGMYLGLIAIAGFIDRYLIPLLPIGLALAAQKADSALGARGTIQKVCLAGGFMAVVVEGILSIGGTHDYLSWNRARWRAVTYLTAQGGVTPDRIDGGFEFNGFYLYSDAFKTEPEKSWWWVKDDMFVIAFGPLAGYRVVESFPYDKLIPVEKGTIFLLRREGQRRRGDPRLQDDARGPGVDPLRAPAGGR